MKLTDIHEQDDNAEEDQPTVVLKDEAWLSMAGYGLLTAKIAKLNARARKLHVPEIRLVSLGERFDQKDPNDPDSPKVKFVNIKIEGESPKIPGGWEFIATIQHTPNGNVIRTVPGYEGVENIKDFYDARPEYCDQCKKKRDRIDTFIVKNPEGKMRQIGRNCLRDFLGGIDPKSILWYFSMIKSFQQLADEAEERAERGGGGRRGDLYVEPLRVLAGAFAAVRNYGYRKSTMGYSGSTSNMVRLGMFPYYGYGKLSKDEAEWTAVTKHPTAEDIKKAEELITWFKALPATEKEQPFIHNVDVLVSASGVTSRDIGFICAMIPIHARMMGLIKQKEEQAKKSNEWIGTVGQKISPTKIKVVGTREIGTDFGRVQIVSMEDEKGNSLVWFNSGRNFATAHNLIGADEELTIVGKVKKHGDYKGRKQTNLTRVKSV